MLQFLLKCTALILYRIYYRCIIYLRLFYPDANIHVMIFRDPFARNMGIIAKIYHHLDECQSHQDTLRDY